MKNKSENIDRLLKDALRCTETPSPELVRQVKNRSFKEETLLKKTNFKRSFYAASAAVMTLALLTTTAFAAWQFLKPSEVAKQFEDKALSAAFESEAAVQTDDSVTSGGYTFTLLGVLSGKELADNPNYVNGEIDDERTYTVLAIQKADGSPMPATQDDEYGMTQFYVSPYVKGFKPWELNAHTLGGGYSETVVDGVMYRILDTHEVTMFADRGVYLGVNTGVMYNSQAISYDEQTGKLAANPKAGEVSVLFDLPLDPALADPSKAEQYLQNFFDSEEKAEAGLPEEDNRLTGIDWDKAVPVASTVKELKVDDRGVLTFTYETDGYGGGTFVVEAKETFTDMKTAQSVITHIMGDENNVYAVRMTIDENGVITGMLVVPE